MTEVVDPNTNYARLSTAEKIHLAMNLAQATCIREACLKAFEEARRRFPGPNFHNGRGDAFLHCYWSALLTRKIGMNQTKAFTDAHENWPGNPPEEKEMDLHNNMRGIVIGVMHGPRASDKELADACERALLQGRLKVLVP